MAEVVRVARDLVNAGDREGALRELRAAHGGSELVAEFAVAALGSEFGRAMELMGRFGADEHRAAGSLGLRIYHAHSDADDPIAAQVTLELVMDHSPPPIAAAAMVSRAAHFARSGADDRAEALWLRAMEIGDAKAIAVAGYNLGAWRENRGDEWEGDRRDTEGAIAAYRRVLEAGSGLPIAGAGMRLGRLLEERGDTEGADRAYARAYEVDDDGDSAIELMRTLLGDLSDDEVAAAVDLAMRMVAEGPWPEATAFACNLVGMAAKDAGDLAEAEAWLRRAVEMDREISAFAADALAEVRDRA
ncbi:hypothetical protein [Spirillospora sp. CA-294931]|uniref:hypothetical protein n=1 Tax=Spirillospora sp. CA-294931 TaxID=3240042 RepID=UPI003D8C9CC8